MLSLLGPLLPLGWGLLTAPSLLLALTAVGQPTLGASVTCRHAVMSQRCSCSPKQLQPRTCPAPLGPTKPLGRSGAPSPAQQSVPSPCGRESPTLGSAPINPADQAPSGGRQGPSRTWRAAGDLSCLGCSGSMDRELGLCGQLAYLAVPWEATVLPPTASRLFLLDDLLLEFSELSFSSV